MKNVTRETMINGVSAEEKEEKKMAKINIYNYDDGCLGFQVCGVDYRTNNQREGLWKHAESSTQWYADGTPYYEWRQISGTCQFQPPKSRSGQYKYIKRWFADEIEIEDSDL